MLEGSVSMARCPRYVIPRLRLLCALVCLASGCALHDAECMLPPAPQATVARIPAGYNSSNTLYVGIAVTDFGWRYADLPAWAHSRDLIGAALMQWYGLPAHRYTTLTNPGRAELEKCLTRDVKKLAQGCDLAIVYLGTHHLKGGAILLGNRERIDAEALDRLLRQIPCRKVLLADMCYAARLEQEAEFADDVVRLHACPADRRGPDVHFSRTKPGVRKFFAQTRALARDELGFRARRFSLFGFLIGHALALERRADAPQLTVQRLFERVQEEARELDHSVRAFSPPIPAAANVQPWSWATRASAREHACE